METHLHRGQGRSIPVLLVASACGANGRTRLGPVRTHCRVDHITHINTGRGLRVVDGGSRQRRDCPVLDASPTGANGADAGGLGFQHPEVGGAILALRVGFGWVVGPQLVSGRLAGGLTFLPKSDWFPLVPGTIRPTRSVPPIGGSATSATCATGLVRRGLWVAVGVRGSATGLVFRYRVRAADRRRSGGSGDSGLCGGWKVSGPCFPKVLSLIPLRHMTVGGLDVHRQNVVTSSRPISPRSPPSLLRWLSHTEFSMSHTARLTRRSANSSSLLPVGASFVVLQDLADRVSPRVLHAPTRLDAVAAQIDEYFTGGRRAFDIPLDWQLATGFKRRPSITWQHSRLRPDGQLRRCRRTHRPSTRRPLCGHGLRRQPATYRRALPPCRPLRPPSRFNTLAAPTRSWLCLLLRQGEPRPRSRYEVAPRVRPAAPSSRTAVVDMNG